MPFFQRKSHLPDLNRAMILKNVDSHIRPGARIQNEREFEIIVHCLRTAKNNDVAMKQKWDSRGKIDKGRKHSYIGLLSRLWGVCEGKKKKRDRGDYKWYKKNEGRTESKNMMLKNWRSHEFILALLKSMTSPIFTIIDGKLLKRHCIIYEM